jgi:pyridoxal phosphate enzyme (YggS family)
MHNISDNLVSIHRRIHSACKKSGRPESAVQLLAVSKTQPAAAIRAACACGQTAFGENYLQEALDKQAELTDLALEWHFIGPLQANKTRPVATHFSWVHSVDRLRIARRLSEQRPPQLPPLQICLQVNLDGEASKSGVSLAELPALAAAVAALPRLQLRGLMAIPAPRENADDQQAVFATLCAALATLQQQLPDTRLDTLSMGMSADLEAAIAAGATIVRIGTDIFGRRAQP